VRQADGCDAPRFEALMILYSREASPFAARVRFSILAKQSPVEIVDALDLQNNEFGRLNPMRKVPVLRLPDGDSIPESEIIVQYLEEVFPEPALLPGDARERSRVRLIARVAETYLIPAALQLLQLRYMPAAPEEQRSAAEICLEEALSNLEALVDADAEAGYAWGRRPSLADGALAPFLFYAFKAAGPRSDSLLSDRPQLARFWSALHNNPPAQTVVDQMSAALVRLTQAARRAS
jgi:glutathione S-transferase